MFSKFQVAGAAVVRTVTFISYEGCEQGRGSTDFTKKTTRISDFEDTFDGLADFQGSADHGFLQYFSMDYGFCLF